MISDWCLGLLWSTGEHCLGFIMFSKDNTAVADCKTELRESGMCPIMHNGKVKVQVQVRHDRLAPHRGKLLTVNFLAQALFCLGTQNGASVDVTRRPPFQK